MKLIYGTGNPGKLASMRRRLSGTNMHIVGLKDIDRDIPEVVENGKTPLENAKIKATAYYKAFGQPVFSCDSGLYFNNVLEEIQPGVHVRNVNGKYLSDWEMIDYYRGLAKEYGDLTARYRNAIVLVMDNEHIYEAMDDSLASEPFIITSFPHKTVRQGFPLDSLSVDIRTGKYYYDLEGYGVDEVAAEKGFLDFFEKALEQYK